MPITPANLEDLKNKVKRDLPKPQSQLHGKVTWTSQGIDKKPVPLAAQPAEKPLSSVELRRK